VIGKRLAAAQRELAEQSRFDYVVVNERDRLNESADTVLAIMTAERCRVGRKPVEL
jgi:guanylate kinase